MRPGQTPIPRAERLASRQHGALTRRQALEAGLAAHQVDWLVATGRWRIAARAVYVVGGAPDTWQKRATVAWLAGPPGTVASHLTAAALLGLADPPPVPHVTVPRGRNGSIRGAIVHWARMPAGRIDTGLVSGVRCTAPARTLADCAGLVRSETLCDLVDMAICRRVSRPAAILSAARRAERAPGRQGTSQLRHALAVWAPGPVADAVTETRLARRLQQWGCPPLERQIKVRDSSGRVVAKGDLGVTGWKVIFEYDGEKAHSPRHWQHDDERDVGVEKLGWAVERFTRADLLPSSTRLHDILARYLAAGRPAA